MGNLRAGNGDNTGSLTLLLSLLSLDLGKQRDFDIIVIRAVESEFKSNPIFPIFSSFPILYDILYDFIRFLSNFIRFLSDFSDF